MNSLTISIQKMNQKFNQKGTKMNKNSNFKGEKIIRRKFIEACFE